MPDTQTKVAPPSVVTVAPAPSEVIASSAVIPVKAETRTDKDDAAADANKTRVVLKALKAMEQNIANVIRLLESGPGAPAEASRGPAEIAELSATRELGAAAMMPVDGRVVEGVFDGQNMVGADGKVYTVPANYASKSKLVEGDLLKLTITPKGSFIYKQIGPIDRSRVIAALGFDATVGEYYATTENRRWSVIKASVTYYKGEPGDEAVLLVPKNTPSKWAAVENIIKKNPLVS